MSQLTQTIVGAICLAAVYLVLQSTRARRRLPLPPGPPKLPIIGNLLQIPTSKQYEVYKVWGEQYGDSHSGIIHIDAAGRSIVIINKAKAAGELLEKRIYSSRPPAPMAYDLMGWNWSIGMQPYGERWRARRRTFHDSFNIEAAKLFHPQQLEATRILLSELLKRPEEYTELLKYHTARTVMSIAYGIKVQSKSDPWVALAEEAIGPLMRATVPGAFLVDTFPFLKYIPSWLPGAGFKRQAQEWRKLTMRLRNEPFVEGKRIIESGEYIPSFISESLQRLDELEDPLVQAQAGRQEKENLIRDTAGTMYLAGVDSTATAITSFIYSMATHPDIQRQAQAEVDRVVVGRLPTFKDEKSLPYVTALVWEVLRWKSVSPLGLAHYLESEDVYEGYRIPKGSVVVSNIWAILHDEEIYIDPFEFDPERYFKPGTREFDETVKDPTFAVFGFGRRICPGRHMAYASIWIAVASILKTFDISKKVDEKGNVVEPVYEQQTAIVAAPRPFECTIKPRSDEAERLIMGAGE